MIILAAADIHGSQHRLNLILKNIERYSPDLVIICGDITQFGPGEVAKNFLNQIPVETYAIRGNIDSPDVAKAIDDSKATKIELKKLSKKGISFIGTPGFDSRDLNYIKEKKLIDNNSVLITHIPPNGLQDKIYVGMHGGSKDLKKLIDETHPKLVLSGHIHEDPGFTKYKDTIVVNCSLGKRGEGALIDINEKISVKMLE